MFLQGQKRPKDLLLRLMKTPERWRALPRRCPCQYSVLPHRPSNTDILHIATVNYDWQRPFNYPTENDDLKVLYIIHHGVILTAWHHVTLRDVMTSRCDVTWHLMSWQWVYMGHPIRSVENSRFPTWRPWPLTYDLDLQTLPRYYQGTSLIKLDSVEARNEPVSSQYYWLLHLSQ